jgi:hypothetical protein
MLPLIKSPNLLFVVVAVEEEEEEELILKYKSVMTSIQCC